MKVMIKQHLIQNKITLQTASLSLFRLFIQGRTQEFLPGGLTFFIFLGGHIGFTGPGGGG